MSVRMTMLALVCVTALVAPLVTSAQGTLVDSSLRAGDWVRAVRMRGRDVTGALVSIGDHGILINARSGHVDTLPASSVGELWRSRGAGTCSSRRPGCVIGGFLIGAAVGGGVGYELGALADRHARANHACSDGPPCDLQRWIGTAIGGLFGSVVGFGIGASIGGEQWERIPSPVPRVGLMLAPRSSVTLAWHRQF